MQKSNSCQRQELLKYIQTEKDTKLKNPYN